MRPLEGVFGAEVQGILLKEVKQGRNDSIINQIIRDLRKYRVLVVRDQVINYLLTPKVMLEMSLLHFQLPKTVRLILVVRKCCHCHLML